MPNETTGYGKIKIDKWKQLATNNCDINILNERLEGLTKGWWEGSMCQSSFLKEEDRAIRTKRQQGGVALITNGKSTSHIIEQGGEERNLRRWRWIVVRGKEQKKP